MESVNGERPRSPIPVFIPITLGIVAVSFSSILIKMSSAPASVLGMYRLLFTVVLMLPFVPKYWRQVFSLTKWEWGQLMLSGLFLGLHFLFWIGSLKYTTVASSTILLSLQPLFVMFGAFLAFRERTTLVALFAAAVAFLGVIVVSAGDLGQPGETLFGDILSILGAAAISVNMLIGQRLRKHMSSFVYSFLIFLIAGLMLALFNILTGISLVAYPAQEWRLFLLLAIIPTVFGHALFNWLLKFVGATTISMSILGEPIGAILLAYLLLGEPITLYHVIGGTLTLAGVFTFLRTKKLGVERAGTPEVS